MTHTNNTRPVFEKPPVGNTCECTCCGHRFTTDANFRRHRVGPMSDRRCLAPSEIEARGLALNTRGVWTEAAPAGGLPNWQTAAAA